MFRLKRLHLVSLDEAFQHRTSTALLRCVIGVPSAVANIFALAVLVGEAPEVGRVNRLAARVFFAPVTEPVIELPAIQSALQTPIGLVLEIFQAKGVFGAGFPIRWRIPN